MMHGEIIGAEQAEKTPHARVGFKQALSAGGLIFKIRLELCRSDGREDDQCEESNGSTTHEFHHRHIDCSIRKKGYIVNLTRLCPRGEDALRAFELSEIINPHNLN